MSDVKNKRQLIYFVILFFGFVFLLIPAVQQLLLSFGENVVLHRKLNNPENWLLFMRVIASAGLYFLITLPLLKKRSFPVVFCYVILSVFLLSNINLNLSHTFVGYHNWWNFGDFAVDEYGVLVNPYDNNYPPIGTLFFKVLHNAGYLSEYSSHAFNYYVTLYTLITGLLLYEFSKKMMQRGEGVKTAVALSLFATGPVLFAYQRLNLLLLSLCFVMYYMITYNSKNKVVRETGFISLAIAANLKLYPAIYGAFLLKEKRWAEAVRCAGYGLLLFVVPSFFLDGGISNIRYFFHASSQWSGNLLLSGAGMSLASSVIRWLRPFAGDAFLSAIANPVAVIAFAVCLLLFFLSKKRYQEFLFLGYMIVLIPTPAYYYNCVFFILAVISLCNEENFGFFEKIEAGLLSVAMVFSYTLPWLQPDRIWHVYLLFIVLTAHVIREHLHDN